jgi:hypothetical protein
MRGLNWAIQSALVPKERQARQFGFRGFAASGLSPNHGSVFSNASARSTPAYAGISMIADYFRLFTYSATAFA